MEEETRDSTVILPGFIVLEGLDGAGTTTQMKRVVEKMQLSSYPCFGTCEPTEGPIGTLIRQILAKKIDVEPSTLAYLFASDRNEHLWSREKGLFNHCRRKDLVVCDRYLFSSLAYQSLESGYDFVYSLNKRFPLPEWCIFIEVPPEICHKRITLRKEKELFEDLEIQKRILDNYERAFSSLVPRGIKFLRVDGTLPEARVTEMIWSFLDI